MPPSYGTKMIWHCVLGFGENFMRIRIALWSYEMHPTLGANLSYKFIQTLLRIDLNRFYVSLETNYHP